jgi:arylformamidase
VALSARGKQHDTEPLDKFIGEAVIIDASGRNSISANDFSGNDIVLISTDSGDQRTDFAYLEVSAAEWLVEHGIKCVGIDTSSVEKYGRKDAPVHKMLLACNIGIIENLASTISVIIMYTCLSHLILNCSRYI